MRELKTGGFARFGRELCYRTLASSQTSGGSRGYCRVQQLSSKRLFIPFSHRRLCSAQSAKSADRSRSLAVSPAQLSVNNHGPENILRFPRYHLEGPGDIIQRVLVGDERGHVDLTFGNQVNGRWIVRRL